jgi:NADH-quinone oxidoreductase subunit L
MVAAGVFLIARIYPLMSANIASLPPLTPTVALQVVTWIGAITALFGSFVAVAHYDIKRILAYSTVSQLGYMMMGLGVGGPSVGMFHLITHAFFKALLFLGAGSVIHGVSGEQDIRHMGGIRKYMPITFAAYTCGMLALCGFPLFAGFWSKDEILHSAFAWSISRIPFYMGAFGALLTAFYMTRQMCYVFIGSYRGAHAAPSHDQETPEEQAVADHETHVHAPHESPLVMTAPLVILAVFAVLLGFLGTPAWPWFQSFLEGEHTAFSFAGFAATNTVPLMLASSVIVLLGLFAGWSVYGRKPIQSANAPDALEVAAPFAMSTLGNAFYIDALYGATVLRLNAWGAVLSNLADRFIWGGFVKAFSFFILGLGWLDNFFDKYVVNAGFDAGCTSVSLGGRTLALLQRGRVQGYLRTIGVALIVIVILMLWGAKA